MFSLNNTHYTWKIIFYSVLNKKYDISISEVEHEVIISNLETLDNADNIARYRLQNISVEKKYPLCEINANRKIIKTMTRLRTRHFTDLKINLDPTRSYKTYNNCPKEGLSPEHIFSCPPVFTTLQELGEGENRYPLFNLTSWT